MPTTPLRLPENSPQTKTLLLPETAYAKAETPWYTILTMTDSHEPQPIRKNPSYFRKEPLVVTEKMRQEIRGAFAEIDMEQIKILKRMTPTERFLQACATNHAVNRVAVYQLLRRELDLDEGEAWKIVHSSKVIQWTLQRKKNAMKTDPPNIEKFGSKKLDLTDTWYEVYSEAQKLLDTDSI